MPRLRGDEGKPSRFQQGYFILNSLARGRASLIMPKISGLRGRYETPKKYGKSLPYDVRRGPIRTRPRMFARSKARLTARSKMFLPSSEWNTNGGTSTMYIGNFLASNVRQSANLFPSSTDLYENGTTIDFDSPKQHIGVSTFCTKVGLTAAMKNAFRAAQGSQAFDGTSLLNNGGMAGQYFTAGNDFADYNPELTGVGNFRNQEINFLFEQFSLKKTFQNSCSNTLLFKVEIYKTRYPKFTTSTGTGLNTNPNLYGNYQPADLGTLIADLNSATSTLSNIGDEAPPPNIAYSGRRSPLDFGESLSKYSAVRQYFRKCGKTMSFVVKPGEQRDIRFVTRGKHRMNLVKLRMFQEYSTTYHIAVTCSASVVGSNSTTAVSHGSGQYYTTENHSIKMRFAGMSKCPAVTRMSDTLSGITAAAQQCVNPETDAAQLYAEGS